MTGEMVTLRSATWNPRAAGQGGHGEEARLFVHNLVAGLVQRLGSLPTGVAWRPHGLTPRSRRVGPSERRRA